MTLISVKRALLRARTEQDKRLAADTTYRSVGQPTVGWTDPNDS